MAMEDGGRAARQDRLNDVKMSRFTTLIKGFMASELYLARIIDLEDFEQHIAMPALFGSEPESALNRRFPGVTPINRPPKYPPLSTYRPEIEEGFRELLKYNFLKVREVDACLEALGWMSMAEVIPFPARPAAVTAPDHTELAPVIHPPEWAAYAEQVEQERHAYGLA